MSIEDLSLDDLFRVEAQSQVAKLTDGLIALEEGVSAAGLEDLMRAAHSLKGAARIVGHDSAVRVAHELEECFVAAQEGRLKLTRDRIDVLLQGVDVLSAIAAMGAEGAAAMGTRVDAMLRALKSVNVPGEIAVPQLQAGDALAPAAEQAAPPDDSERLLSLAGEALVAARALAAATTGDALARDSDRGAEQAFENVRRVLSRMHGAEEALQTLTALHAVVLENAAKRRLRAGALDAMGQRVSDAVGQLYQTVLDARMRPFGDGTAGMPRMARDTSRELGRDVRLVVGGESTPVDREVLRRLEAPLGHLIRNAIDHGIETPDERVRKGKESRGTVRVDARHAGGRLLVSVEDDGRGVDLEAVRNRIVQRSLADEAAVRTMSDAELLSFLFLPGFTMRDAVTSISGRGVGLDVVHTAVREIGGDVRIVRGKTDGARFELQLPLTLSVVRSLVVEISGEPYAFPLARVHRVLRVDGDDISSVEGRQHFTLEEREVAIVWAHQLLGVGRPTFDGAAPVVVVGDQDAAIGIAVDKLLGEYELVLRGMDARLGKVQDVGGAAILPDGTPTLVLDVEDLLRSATNLAAGGRLHALQEEAASVVATRKRVLVVDDSLTVRELERKMIEGKGYAVDVAVDGMDAWNAVRSGHYALVVTDVDMPRMDGIELVTRIKADAQLRATPVMIVSYKDRDEDRRRGMDAGADYYLTKGSFYDETMLRAIEDFIGAAS